MREYLKDAQNKKKEQEKKIANAHNLSIYEVSDFSCSLRISVKIKKPIKKRFLLSQRAIYNQLLIIYI